VNLCLTKLQKRLCNALQDGLPICPRPFAELAKSLDTNEETVVCETNRLKQAGIIRRIGALIDYRTFGRTATLVTAHVPQTSLDDVTAAVNALQNVSHNYLRKHYYNLWFTLQAATGEEINSTLSGLSAHFGIEFHSLPVKQAFKLDVRFNAENRDSWPVSRDSWPVSRDSCPVTGVLAKLTASQKLILSKLQNELAVTARPFDFLCGEDLSIEDALAILQQLIDAGPIRRIAAVVDHRRLGFVAGVLLVCEVGPDRIVEADSQSLLPAKNLQRLALQPVCDDARPKCRPDSRTNRQIYTRL
jgi:DNA-binding Lrp family transcriptional regulator